MAYLTTLGTIGARGFLIYERRFYNGKEIIY